MKNGFKDPIAPKSYSKSSKSPWNFNQPPYDERSSCYINAGTHYGVGYKTPVGKIGKAIAKVSTLPFGRINTKKVDEVPYKNMRLDEHE